MGALDMSEPLLICALTMLLLHVAAEVLSRFEKAFRHHRSRQPVRVELPRSLTVLKIARSALFILGATEAAYLGSWSGVNLTLGLILLTFGMALRVLAIRALGPLWSYHADIKRGHQVVDTGIYRWMRHPAYFGNVHIGGLLLIVGSPFTGAIAVALAFLFYLLRERRESRLLKFIEPQAHA